MLTHQSIVRQCGAPGIGSIGDVGFSRYVSYVRNALGAKIHANDIETASERKRNQGPRRGGSGGLVISVIVVYTIYYM